MADTPHKPKFSGSVSRRIRQLSGELAAREVEALRIVEPMPQQIEFFNLTSIRDGRRMQTRVRLATGPNRSSKTFTNMLDFAMLVAGCHPVRHFPSGYQGRAYCIGRKMESLAEIYYQKLFMPGPFRVITDKHTGRIRAFRPKDEEDVLRQSEVRQGPPLIPERMIVGKPAFWQKSTRQIKNITIHNDMDQTWEISFFTALGDAPRGVDVDDVRMTEELESSTYIDELFPRLMDRRGCMSWDFTPQDGTDHAMSMIDEAEASVKDPQADVRMVRMSLRNNPHISSDEVAFQIRRLSGSPGAVAVRIDGFPETKASRMYPDFTPRNCNISINDLGGSIPEDFCVYVGVDPGYAKAGVVFMAVPPKHHSLAQHIILYDEIFIRQESEDDLVRRIKLKLGGREPYAILMDFVMSNRTEITSVKIGEYFRNAFKKYNLRSKANGFGYRNGLPNRTIRASVVRDALAPRIAGRSYVQVIEGACPNWEAQISKIRRKRTKGRGGVWIYDDIPAEKQVDELYDAFGYVLCDDPAYHSPTPLEDQVLELNDRKAKERQALKHKTIVPYSGLCLGPTSAAGAALVS